MRNGLMSARRRRKRGPDSSSGFEHRAKVSGVTRKSHPAVLPASPTTNSLNQSYPLVVDVSQPGNPVVILCRVVCEPRRGPEMPVIVLIASTLIFWLIYWFVRMDGVDHVRVYFQQRKDAARRIKARETERTAPLSAIDDRSEEHTSE